MKKILSLVLLFLFFFFVKTSYAQSPTPEAIESTTIGTDEETPNSFTLDPPLLQINDFLSTVSVQFNNPDIITGGGDGMFVCLEKDLCIDNDDIRNGVSEGKQESVDKATRGMDKGDVDEDTIQRYKLISGKIVVCGDGSSKLKGSKEYFGSNYRPKNEGCVEGRDYFHAGSIHLLSAYQKNGNTYTLMAVAGFYINHGMINEPKINPSIGIPVKGANFDITVSTDHIRPGGSKRNNYKVELIGPGVVATKGYRNTNFYEQGNGEKCITLSSGKKSETAKLPTNTNISPGLYTIRIREQVDDDRDCFGGFTYWKVNCRVSVDTTKSKCDKPIEDPDKVDLTSAAKLFAALGNKGIGTRLPCKLGHTIDNPLKCEAIDTAIGRIPIDPVGIVARLFSIVLSIAGLGALLLIIYSGYRLLMSRGNKEVIQGARETLTAAIIGLLFIVFSLVILSVIAGNILKIPGFG